MQGLFFILSIKKGHIMLECTNDIAEIMQSTPEARDSDELLFDLYLLKTMNIDSRMITAHDLLLKLAERSIQNIETISRCRRRIQEKHPTLRGSIYYKRHHLAEQIRLEMR